MRLLPILAALMLLCAAVDAKPFFDAIYDALSGNGKRSWGYGGGYAGYGYNGYSGYNGYNSRPQPRHDQHRGGKSYKELCRVHHPDSIAQPGAGGIICPY